MSTISKSLYNTSQKAIFSQLIKNKNNARCIANHTLIILLLFSLCLIAPVAAQDEPAEPESKSPNTNSDGMSVEKLDKILRRIDPNLSQNGNTWEFTFNEQNIIVVSDPVADRMRIMAPVISSSELEPAEMYRLLQANFDSALDARYAVAQDILWSVFIHPLSPLDADQLASGLLQVFNATITFGTTYNSGAVTFGGGDSNEELEELQRALDEQRSPTT